MEAMAERIQEPQPVLTLMRVEERRFTRQGLLHQTELLCDTNSRIKINERDVSNLIAWEIHKLRMQYSDITTPPYKAGKNPVAIVNKAIWALSSYAQSSLNKIFRANGHWLVGHYDICGRIFVWIFVQFFGGKVVVFLIDWKSCKLILKKVDVKCNSDKLCIL